MSQKPEFSFESLLVDDYVSGHGQVTSPLAFPFQSDFQPSSFDNSRCSTCLSTPLSSVPSTNAPSVGESTQIYQNYYATGGSSSSVVMNELPNQAFGPMFPIAPLQGNKQVNNLKLSFKDHIEWHNANFHESAAEKSFDVLSFKSEPSPTIAPPIMINAPTHKSSSSNHLINSSHPNSSRNFMSPSHEQLSMSRTTSVHSFPDELSHSLNAFATNLDVVMNRALDKFSNQLDLVLAEKLNKFQDRLDATLSQTNLLHSGSSLSAAKYSTPQPTESKSQPENIQPRLSSSLASSFVIAPDLSPEMIIKLMKSTQATRNIQFPLTSNQTGLRGSDASKIFSGLITSKISTADLRMKKQ